MNKVLDTLHPACATFRTSAEKHYGFGDPLTEGAAAAPTLERGFFYVHMLRVAHGSFFGGPCWDTRKGVPVPSAGSPTRHGLPPSFGDEGGRFQTCSEGAFMANTTPTGRTAPASKPTKGNPTQFDPVALHGEAINACSMATYYTRKGNHAGAARKSVQALAALRRLQAVIAKTNTNPCTKCPDNFALPAVRDYFDRVVVAGYVARRTACDKCPENTKPCLAVAGDLEVTK